MGTRASGKRYLILVRGWQGIRSAGKLEEAFARRRSVQMLDGGLSKWRHKHRDRSFGSVQR